MQGHSMLSEVGNYFYWELSIIQAMDKVIAHLSAKNLLQLYLKQGISLIFVMVLPIFMSILLYDHFI